MFFFPVTIGGGRDAAVAVDVIEQEAEGMMRYPSLGPSPEGDHYGFKSAGIENEQLGKSIIGTARTATRPLTLDELVALIAVNKGSPGFPHEKYKEHLENAMHKVRWGLSYVPRDQRETAVSGGTKERL